MRRVEGRGEEARAECRGTGPGAQVRSSGSAADSWSSAAYLLFFRTSSSSSSSLSTATGAQERFQLQNAAEGHEAELHQLQGVSIIYKINLSIT